MQVIASMATPNGNLVELVSTDGLYRTRLYVYESDADHELTATDAAEFVDVVRAVGGHVYLTPQNAALKGTS